MHKFRHLIMQHVSMEQHINKICKLGTWGTQVEIFAAATLYNIPVYVACQNPKSLQYSWCKYTAILLDDHASQVSLTSDIIHVEFIHINGNHFDGIDPIHSSNSITLLHKQGGTID